MRPLPHVLHSAEGDVVLLNDPYQGGNHLPDLTMVSAIGAAELGMANDASGSPTHDEGPHFFVASRAHHADVGGMSPGSMPFRPSCSRKASSFRPLKIVAGRENEMKRCGS